jgi:hypothetical protein
MRQILTLPIVMLALASCGGSTNSPTQTPVPLTVTPPRRSSSPPSTTSPTASSEPSADEAVAAFAPSYARYLDGQIGADALPDITARARVQVGQLLPAKARLGRLTVRSLTASSGASTFIARLADRAHSFDVQLTVARVGERELIVTVIPPDFDSLLAAPPRPVPQAPGSARAERSARVFLAGYLRWLYGQASLPTIEHATPGLLAGLTSHPPRIPPATRSLHAAVAAIAMQRHGRGWQALPSVTDGRETYELVLTLTQARGRWLVSSVGNPR